MNRTNQMSIIFTLSIIATSSIQAAEKPLQKRPKLNTGPCYFAMIDSPTLDLIAQYLTFSDIEYEEDFIKRTQNTLKKEIPSEYYYDAQSICIENMLTAFCPHEVYAILLASNVLKIVNTKNNRVLRKIILRKDLKKNYKHVALSRNATIFGTIEERSKLDPNSHHTDYITTNHLGIENVATQAKETIVLPGSFSLPYKKSCAPLAFNKQGTHIILHGIDQTQCENFVFALDKEEPMPHYLIFPVTVNHPHALIPPKKTLLHYFQQKGICKSFARRINQ